MTDTIRQPVMQSVNVETGAVLERDPKKYLWMLGLVVPLLPLVSVGVYQATNWWPIAFLVPFLVYAVVPLQDVQYGVDNDNLSESYMESIKAKRYYRVVVELFVPIQYVGFFASMWLIANGGLSLAAQIGMAVSVGMVGGIGINAAHEMGHKPDRFQQWMARISLAQPAYGHFFVEHNRGHHRNVATPEDPASARYGESLYAFLPRTVIYSVLSAWHLEAKRLNRLGKSSVHWQNKNLQSWAMTVVLFGLVVAWLGTGMIWVLAVQAVCGFYMLEVVNYVEHYGLLRQKLTNGRYEKCAPEHSWNSNYKMTNLFLYQLQRHSDHHANPTRTYQILRNFDNAPNLPAGYATMILCATVPPLWFRVMNPRVAEVYEGDLSKANLTARSRRKLERAATVGVDGG